MDKAQGRSRIALATAMGPAVSIAVDFEPAQLRRALEGWSRLVAEQPGLVVGGELDSSLAKIRCAMSSDRAWTTPISETMRGSCILVDKEGRVAFGQRDLHGDIQMRSRHLGFDEITSLSRPAPTATTSPLAR